MDAGVAKQSAQVRGLSATSSLFLTSPPGAVRDPTRSSSHQLWLIRRARDSDFPACSCAVTALLQARRNCFNDHGYYRSVATIRKEEACTELHRADEHLSQMP